MGKVFVKGPVESPDDLLSKGPKWDATKQVTGRVGRGLGKVAGAGLGVAAGALTPASAINSKSQLDYLKDKYEVENQAKEALRQRMQPSIDAQARAKLANYGLEGEGLETAYPGMDPSEALNQEELARNVFNRRKRVSHLQQEADTNREQKELEQKTGVAVVSDASQKPPLSTAMDDMTAAGQKLLQNQRTGMVDDLLEETEEPAPVPDIPAIQNSGHLSDDQNDGKNEVKRVQEIANEQVKVLGANNVNEIQGAEMLNEEPEEPEKGTGIQMPPPNTPFGMSAPPLKNQQEDVNEQQQGVNF